MVGKKCISFKTDMDRLNIVVYRYWNNANVKDTEKELKLTEYEKLLPKRVYLLSYIEDFLSGALYWMKRLLIINVKFLKHGLSFPHDYFPIVPGIKNVIWTQ